jgi:hypothetical protein
MLSEIGHHHACFFSSVGIKFFYNIILAYSCPRNSLLKIKKNGKFTQKSRFNSVFALRRINIMLLRTRMLNMKVYNLTLISDYKFVRGIYCAAALVIYCIWIIKQNIGIKILLRGIPYGDILNKLPP